MTGTYVDSGVLIVAERGSGKLYERAMAIITTEKPEKPIHRTRQVRTVSIDID